MAIFEICWLHSQGYEKQIWHNSSFATVESFKWSMRHANLQSSISPSAPMWVEEILECPYGSECEVCLRAGSQ